MNRVKERDSIRVSAPGKLFLSGEWAILEMGNRGIVAAVERRMYADIQPSRDQKILIHIDDFSLHLSAEYKNDKFIFDSPLSEQQQEQTKFIKGAIESTLAYLESYQPFEISTWGKELHIEVAGEQQKLGFGSSASAVVATVAALFAFHNLPIDTRENQDRIYKLATIAHYFAQGKIGSAFDIAAAAYGGIFVYSRFDPNWLQEQLKKHTVKEVVEMEWPGFIYEALTIPENFNLSVGWSGSSASTSQMIKALKEWKKNNPERHDLHFRSIATTAAEAIAAWRDNEQGRIKELVSQNQTQLESLSKESGVPIATEKLKLLSKIAKNCGGAGKLSGAGGGDCGIAISYDQEITQEIEENWRSSGVTPLTVTLAHTGLRLEEC